MAKCPECGRRKGKRLCPARDARVCSLCCGSLRKADMCGDCTFYKPPARDYDNLPRYSTAEMEDSERLDQISFPIESAVCLLDRNLGFELSDAQAIEILEVLLDLYAFGDTQDALSERIREQRCESVIALVQRELTPYPAEDIAKVLGAVRFVARRRARYGRDHLDVLHCYVGSFIRTNVGLRILEDGTEMVVDPG